MTTTVPILVPLFKAFDNNGVPLAGGFLYSYAAGTTTPLATYPASNETTPNPNPIVLNSRGEALVWLDPTSSYKFNLTDANGSQIPGYPIDNVSGPINLSSNLIPSTTNTYTLGTPVISWANLYLGPNAIPVFDSVSGNVGYFKITAAETAAGVTPSNYAYPPGNALRYGVDPTGTTDSTTAIQQWIDATWAMYQYLDGQGLWNGGGGAVPVMQLPPGKFKVSGTMYLPSGCTFRGTGHPANTVSHTRIIMNSTGANPPVSWTASTTWYVGDIVQPASANGYWYLCTIGGAGGSGTPAWPTTITNTVTDGAATWECYGMTGSGDNRNQPMFKFRRGTLPSGGSLQNSAATSTVSDLEFWFVTMGSSFSNPLSGASLGTQRNYPNGAIFAFDVDMADTRFVNCVFQNSPASFWMKNISTTPATRGDGFTGDRGINFFVENCEFDASSSHVWASGCALDILFKGCQFFESPQYWYGNTGKVVYQGCYLQYQEVLDFGVGIGGGATPAVNAMTSLSIMGTEIEPPQYYPWLSASGINLVNISANTVQYAATYGGLYIQGAIGGAITGNSFDSQGANASAGAGFSSFTAAVKLDGCKNMLVSGNNITASFSATYNGFGILTGTSTATTSQNNFVTDNAVTAGYNGATFNGQDRYINLASGDIRGVNFDAHSGATAPMAGSINAIGSIGVNGATAPAQVTGWGTPTSPTVENNYSGSAATLAQTSGAVAEIIAYLKARGDFGT